MTETEQILTELAQQIILNNVRHLNQSIEDFNNLLSRDPDLALKNLSMLSKEDQQTPPVIIEKMIDNAGWRLPDGTLDTTKIYLDPCCGRGGILAYLYKHYNVPKENLYGIDIKQENVTLCTKLGFNVIKGDALDAGVYIKINDKIKKIKGEYMTIDRVLMNPPYNKSLHLEILQSVMENVKKLNSSAEITSIQPARWLEDTLAEYKQSSDYNKYKTSIVNKVNNLQVIDQLTANKYFGIDGNTDLAIITINNSTKRAASIIPNIVTKIVKKIITKTTITLGDKAEQKKHDGWRCEVKTLGLGSGGTHASGNGLYARQSFVMVVPPNSSVFHNGLTKDGKPWYTTRQDGGQEKTLDIGWSIKFIDEKSANNFRDSCHTNFYKNILYIMKFNLSAPINFLPYMEDYSKVWTDEDYCKFFGLTEEESEFMCRKIDDYRVKDFINYINLDEE